MSRDPAPESTKLPSVCNPHEIRGFHTVQETRPDRVFYVLEHSLQTDVLWEIDGYRRVDENGHEHWFLHIVCPRCGQNLALNSEKRDVEVDEKGILADPFRCSWPGEFGTQCSFRAALVRPRNGESTFPDENGMLRRVDAVFKSA